MNDTSLTVKQVERAILNMHGGMLKVIAVPNVSWGLTGYEADLVVLSRKGYATEYEIKRSWADFQNDIKKKHPKVHYSECIYNFAYVVPKKIGERVKQYFEANTTDYDMPCVYAYDEEGKLNKICGKLHPRKRQVSNCRAMTEKEQFQLARLGTIRYWGLRGKSDEIKNEKK